ncbi:MAG: alanine racemase, partial [Kiritimatiellaeota bacterium]|nr:alanine racemase [Kiritimatiellota bacterium]
METSNEAMVKRLAEIERRMATACDRAWRKKESVKLVAVSKMFPAEAVDEARKAGLQLFGESRIQEAAEKIDQCGSAEWHFVGHLQRNKAKTAVSLFSMIHAVDTVPLLEALAACMKETGRRPALLLEVNVAGDGAKFGFPPALVPGALRRAAALHIPVAGFMTMTPMITAEGTRP